MKVKQCWVGDISKALGKSNTNEEWAELMSEVTILSISVSLHTFKLFRLEIIVWSSGSLISNFEFSGTGLIVSKQILREVLSLTTLPVLSIFTFLRVLGVLAVTDREELSVSTRYELI